MLSLEQQQKSLLRILRGGPETPETAAIEADPWLAEVIHSPGLVMVREIAAWWLRFQIESQCRFTSRLMKRMGCFEDYLEAHARENPVPQAIEELTRQFLSSLACYPDPLLRAVSAFELACLAPPGTHRASTTIWDRNPNAVLYALSKFAAIPGPEPDVQYILTIEPGEPRQVHCTRQTACIPA